MGAKLELEVFVVADGELAIDRVKSEQPGFALLDVSMPKISGIECCKLIKEVSPSTKVILISNVHSLSLQDGAKEANVELFVVDTVAQVKVPEFIEAALAKKELPPEAAEEIEREVLSKRGSQRFPFEGEVQFRIGDNWFSGVFVNVSQDGLLFQTQNEVPLGTNLLLSWMDKGLKHIEVTAIVVRQFSSSILQYPHMVGVQFLKSSSILDKQIAELSDEADLFQEGSEIELDLDLIQELLAKSTKYFRDLFKGGKAPLFLEFSIADIAEHERNAFQNKDEYSLCLQEIVSSKIICQLIENTINQIASSKSLTNTYATRLLTLASEVLEKIEFVEGDSDAFIKKSIPEGLVNERRLLNESNSRLYMAKAAVIGTFCKKIKRENISESHVGGFDLIFKLNKQITSYQQHLDEVTRQEEEERKKKAAERIVKPVEKPAVKVEPQEQIQNQPEQTGTFSLGNIKKTNLPFLAALVVFVALVPWIEEVTQGRFLKVDLPLAVKPISIERKSNQSLVVNLTKEAWEQLGTRGQESVMSQIEIYLTKKQIHQCKIMDGDQTIAAVYGTSSKEYPGFLHTVFLNEPASVVPPSIKVNEPDISSTMDEEAPPVPDTARKKAPTHKKKSKTKKRIKIH